MRLRCLLPLLMGSTSYIWGNPSLQCNFLIILQWNWLDKMVMHFSQPSLPQCQSSSSSVSSQCRHQVVYPCFSPWIDAILNNPVHGWSARTLFLVSHVKIVKFYSSLTCVLSVFCVYCRRSSRAATRRCIICLSADIRLRDVVARSGQQRAHHWFHCVLRYVTWLCSGRQ